MSKVKVSTIKLANSVKVGAKEVVFADNSSYDIYIDGNIITITNIVSQDKVSTSIFNTIWFNVEEGANEQKEEKVSKADEEKPSEGNPEGSSKATKPKSKRSRRSN